MTGRLGPVHLAAILLVARGTPWVAGADATVARTFRFAPAGERGSFPGAVTFEGRQVSVDLAPLPEGSRVLRAVLRVRREPEAPWGGDEAARVPLRIVARGADGDIQLHPRAPRFLDLDATAAVKASVSGEPGASPRRRILFVVESFAGWKPEGTRLDVTVIAPRGAAEKAPVTGSTAAPAEAPARGVRDLRAWHVDGRTFLSWTQAEPGLARETTSIGDLREARRTAAAGPELRYRVYRLPAPRAGAGAGHPGTEGHLAALEAAEIVDEVDGFTAWNEEFPGADCDAGLPARRYSVRDGEPPVAPGTGIYVHRPGARGRARYAVVLARDGEEDLADLLEGRGIAGPVEEVEGPGRPVLQRTESPEEFQYVKGARLEYWVRWECPPEANVPSRPFDYVVAVPPEPRDPAPLCVALHCWGGSLLGGYGWWYGALDGAMMVATNQIPYDWWASYHENLGTLKPFSEGVARSYTPRRVWSFIEWMRTRWRIDANRIFLGGSSMGGSGVSHWIRQGDRFAYGISWVGVHVPALSPQFRGSYENVVGKVEWGVLHESGLPVFEYLDGARALRADPAAETAFLAYSNGKNDSAIGWKQAVDFTRALQETRRPHLFVWGQGGHGQRAYFPTPEGGGDNVRGGLDIRLDRSLPAFTRCSLDDDPGDGDPEKGAREGQINLYLRWRTDGVVDEPARHAVVVYLTADAPAASATTDLTPRRCRAFRPKPGTPLSWTIAPEAGGPEIARGTADADRWGLVTVERLPVAKEPRRLEIRSAEEHRPPAERKP